MPNRHWRGTFVTALIQLVLIAVSTYLAYHLTRHFDIIPKAVLRLPEVFVSTQDLFVMIGIFVFFYAVQIVLTALAYQSHGFSSVKRFASEYVYYLFAYTTASLYTFLATTINYDPQFIAAIGLISTLLYVVAFVVSAAISGVENAGLFATLGGMFKRLVSISGVLALIYFVVPLLLGRAFTSDRDVANQITQIRIWFNPVESSDWGFANTFPGKVFSQPLLVKQAPSDDNSLYVLERGGKLFKLSYPQGDQQELVVDFSANMGEVEVENGALGVAFHPEFGQANQFIFAYYTDTRPDGIQANRLVRFDLSGPDADTRNASETILMELPRTEDGFHNGGSLEFGPDNFLYVGVGEGVHLKGATTSDVTLRGGVLRIDVDMNPETSAPSSKLVEGAIQQNYWVPKDNPFVGNDGILDEYWALGLRNPFRFTFDRNTGDLWLGDVGSTVWEEVNKIEKGKHYQFPVSEGYEISGQEAWENLGLPEEPPIYTYQHNAYDRAVIGGQVIRGGKFVDLEGRYVFADNYSAKVFVMDADKPRVDDVTLLARANQYAQRGISSVVQLRSGEILITTLGAASEPGGEILELVKNDGSQALVETVVEEDTSSKEYDEVTVAALFAVNCARCHGVNGDGKGPDSGMLGVKMPDLTSVEYHQNRSTDAIRDVIVKGGAQMGLSPMMPPWGGFLKEHEIDNLVIYIESLPHKQ